MGGRKARKDYKGSFQAVKERANTPKFSKIFTIVGVSRKDSFGWCEMHFRGDDRPNRIKNVCVFSDTELRVDMASNFTISSDTIALMIVVVFDRNEWKFRFEVDCQWTFRTSTDNSNTILSLLSPASHRILLERVELSQTSTGKCFFSLYWKSQFRNNTKNRRESSCYAKETANSASIILF